jgi:protein TonB
MVTGGHQDNIDDDSIAIGDKIDINTTEYRYLGYFTSMRKSIELVWVYPSEAASRGLHGNVNLEFTIQKNGSVSNIKVVQSSGFKILDDAVIEAIRLASPFAPLPASFDQERKVVTGTFRYVLTSFHSSRSRS